MENDLGTQSGPPAPPPQGENQEKAAAPAKKPAAEFSLAWHLKVLAVIYAALGIFYLILKLTLK